MTRPTRSRSVARTLAILLAALTPAAMGSAQGRTAARAPAAPPGNAMFVPYDDVHWQRILPDLGDRSPEMAILHVDPNTQATQLMIRMPPRFHVRPHFHSANETHTVITGSFLMAHGNRVEELGPGGFNYMPSRMVHEAWSGPGEKTVVFITTDGRWDLNWTNGPPTARDANVDLPPASTSPPPATR